MTQRIFIPTAGVGSRLRHLTSELNKSLISVADRRIERKLENKVIPDHIAGLCFEYYLHVELILFLSLKLMKYFLI